MNAHTRQINLGISRSGRIHMIGIGGASMSGLALMLHQMDYQVTGSSNVEDVRLNQLREKGIRIYITACTSRSK